MNNLNDIFFAPAEDSSMTYDQILEDVQRYFSENHASTIAGTGDGDTERASSVLKELMVQYLVRHRISLQGFTTEELCAKLYEDMAGYSFLKKWIYAPDVEEVNINAYNDIEVIMNSGRSIKIPERFSSPQHAIDVVRRMLNACGMVIDDTMPSVIGFLDRNIRISVDKTPIVDADVGVNASIRIVNQQTVSAEKLLESGSATAEMLHFLTACIRYGVSVCIAGSTGSGKTTIMAWLLSNVPDNRRLITIEEGSREFDLVKRDENGNILNSVVHLLTRPHENPAMDIDQDFLLERVLRKHPDVIGVGEMRSAAESLSAAESSRTGHTVCTTIHSNSCESTYRRMMTLAKRKYSMDDSILMQIMVEAYPVVVFTKQLEDRSRKIMEIIEGEDYIDGKLLYRSLYKYHVEDNVTDSDGNARVLGHHQKAGTISEALRKRFLDNGIPHRELEEFLRPDTTGQKAASLQTEPTGQEAASLRKEHARQEASPYQTEPLAQKTEKLQAEHVGQETAPLQAEPLGQKAAPKTASAQKPAGKKPKAVAPNNGEPSNAMATEAGTDSISAANTESIGMAYAKAESDSITSTKAEPNGRISTEAKLAEYISEKYIPEKPAPARAGNAKTGTVRRIGGKVHLAEEKLPDMKPPAGTEPAIPEADTATGTDTPGPSGNKHTLNESHEKKGG